MTKYVIAWNKDQTETTLTTRENWNKAPLLHVDNYNNPMVVRKEFSANTWEEALEIRDKFLGYNEDRHITKKREQVDQWWELHVKGAARDGKGWGSVMDILTRAPKKYDREELKKARRHYRKGFSKAVKVTRYRLVK